MSDSSSAETASYLRVAAAFRERIADGTWPPDHRLPSRSALGAEFGSVGDNVIRRAQELLINEGLLEGRAGSGTYVRPPQARRALLRSKLTAPRADAPAGVAPAGFSGTWESDSTAKVPAPAGIAARLGLAEGELCVQTTYEFLAERRPVMTATSWEPLSLTGGTIVVLPEGGPFAGHGVIARMAQIDIVVARVAEVPRPVLIDRDQAQVLGISAGSLATCIERTHFTGEGLAVETADFLVPAALWDITYDLPLP